MQAIFNAMRSKFSEKRELLARLSNLANVYDHHGLRTGFNSIYSFVKAK